MVTKNRVNLRQNARVIELEHPAILRLIIDIKNTQTLSWILRRPTCAPGLEGSIAPGRGLITQLKRVKDQGLSFGIKNTAKSSLVPPLLFTSSTSRM
jgi:hypothetical protein